MLKTLQMLLMLLTLIALLMLLQMVFLLSTSVFKPNTLVDSIKLKESSLVDLIGDQNCNLCLHLELVQFAFTLHQTN